jgi:hypothetical protein
MAAFIRFFSGLQARPAPMLAWIILGILGLAAMGRLAPERVESRTTRLTDAERELFSKPLRDPFATESTPAQLQERPPEPPAGGPTIRIAPGEFHFWSREDGNPQTILVDKVRLTIRADPEASNTYILIEAPGRRPRAFEYDAVLGLSVAVGRLDMARPGPQLVVVRRDSGFSCCVALDLATPVGDSWRSKEIGRWSDVGVGDRLTDRDGDGAPDFVATDMDYYREFHGYGRWSSPDEVLQIRAGRIVDVSHSKAFAPMYQEQMQARRKSCEMDHDNSSCAAFVALAARLGRFDWAWAIMLRNYNKEEPWSARCVRRGGKERCSDDPSDWRSDFPAALREGLEHTGYL